MAAIHQLVQLHGKQEAKGLVDPERRHLVDLAADILSEEARTTGFSYSGFCLTALPHRGLADDEKWLRRGNRVQLLIEPGHEPGPDGELRKVGVPYGSKARLILLYLQKHAILNNSPEVELGRSMNQWLTRMGVKIGGAAYKDVREQAKRISLCRLTFYWNTEANDRVGITNESIVHSSINLRADDRQGSLFPETVRLSTGFFEALKKHPVPIWEDGVRRISGKSMAIDVYVWLAYRLHILDKPTPVSWTALHDQFGGGFKELKHFKPEFKKALDLATTVYQDANLTVDETGVTLLPSLPPVSKRTTSFIIGR